MKMVRCEDWPCCGHAEGDCPQYTKSGRLRCTCGRPLPKNSRYSICRQCLQRLARRDSYDDPAGQD